MAKVEHCSQCGAPKDWDILTNGYHDKLLCEGRQLIQLRAENKKLKKSLEEWKDAWFQLREIIGNLWWHHPAIDNDKQRAYYKHQLDSITPVSYDGFIGTKADWHYKSWTNQTESPEGECQKEQSK